MDKIQRYWIGLATVRFVTGLKYFWPVTDTYHRTRFRLYQERRIVAYLDLIECLTLFFEFLGIVCSYKLLKSYRIRVLSAFSIVSVTIAFLHCHFLTDVSKFLIIYPFTTGFFYGLISVSIIFPIIERSTKNAGMAIAVSKAASLSGLIPAFLLTELVNPNDEEPQGKIEKLYEASMMGLFQEVMSFYAIWILVVGLIAVLIMNSNLKNFKDEWRELYKKRQEEKSNATIKIDRYGNLDLQKSDYFSLIGLSFILSAFVAHFLYFQTQYMKRKIPEETSEWSFIIVIIAVLAIGYAYDKMQEAKTYLSFKYIFIYIYIISLWLHTYTYNEITDAKKDDSSGITSINSKLALNYIFFSVLTNSAELVIGMTLIKIFENRPKMLIIKIFSVISIGPLFTCVAFICYENLSNIIGLDENTINQKNQISSLSTGYIKDLIMSASLLMICMAVISMIIYRHLANEKIRCSCEDSKEPLIVKNNE